MLLIILQALLLELAATNARFILPIASHEAYEHFIQDLNDIEHSQSIDRMCKGLDSKDWSDMITHHVYYSMSEG